MAKRTASGLNEIRKLINIETKFLNVASSQTVSNTGSIVPLSQIVQGVNYTERIGDSIKIQKIEFRCKVSMSTSASFTNFRLIIFRDLYQQGADPTITNVLGSASTLNPKNFLLRDRFSLLVDEMFVMSVSGDNACSLEYNIPHEGHIKYIGTTAATASNGFGSIYMLVLSDEATNVPTIAYNSNIYFTDD